jgi:hypothetical protein
MTQELGKYYLRFAWFPKILDGGENIWFKNYYEVHLDLPILDPVYTIRRISTVDYVIESLKGNIANGRHVGHFDSYAFERMLNAAKLNNFGFKDAELD